MIREDIDRIVSEIEALKCKTQKEVEEARVRFLGKKGEITALFEEFRNIDKETVRREVFEGQELQDTCQRSPGSPRSNQAHISEQSRD